MQVQFCGKGVTHIENDSLLRSSLWKTRDRLCNPRWQVPFWRSAAGSTEMRDHETLNPKPIDILCNPRSQVPFWRSAAGSTEMRDPSRGGVSSLLAARTERATEGAARA